MKRQDAVGFTIAVLIAAISLIAPQLQAVPSVHAEGLTSNVGQQNSAEWTVEEAAFVSNYPTGFSFTIKVSSSGGEVTRARAIWYSPNLRASQTRAIEAEEAVYDAAAGVWTATWEADTLNMVPPWVEVMYHWELRDEADNRYETEPAIAEYADQTHEWTRSESDGAIVFTLDLPGEVEAVVLSAIDERLPLYQEVWGGVLPRKPRIILFGDYDVWMEWRTVPEYSDTSRIVGQTFDNWNAIVQVLYGQNMEQAIDELAYSTVVHEMEHLYQAEYVAATRDIYDVPTWFPEGDATFFELHQSYDYLARIQDMARNGELPPLLVGVADAPRTDGDTARDGYDIGYSFFVWMQEQAGDLSWHRKAMQLLAEDVPFFEMLEQVTGMSTAEIEQNWRVWLGASPMAPTLIPTWTPNIPVIATQAPMHK
ncbi:MAG TPA: hypothetical protein VHP83_21800 [Aggregatilineaceae bacterium]|nr:hypothetical protein [Aggregatilineaceae bacterium]